MKFLQAQAAGSETHDAWNKNSVYFVKAAMVHISCHLFSLFLVLSLYQVFSFQSVFYSGVLASDS